MKQRRNIFETNSSSSHSISLNPWITGRDGNDFPDEGEIVITGGEFGWGWDSGNGSSMKANYFATEYKDYPEELEKLKEVIEEYTGQTVRIEVSEDAYIDHQSSGTVLDSLGNTGKEDIKNFVFNPDVWLYIGNDNSDYPPGFNEEEIREVHSGRTYTMTIQFKERKIDILFPGYPDEDAIESKFAEDTALVDGYELHSIDFPEKSLVFQHYWKDSEPVVAKILKITSEEYGDIL